MIKIAKRLKASKVLYNVDISDYTDDVWMYELDNLKRFLDYCIEELNTDNYIVFSALGLWSGSVEGYKFRRVYSHEDIFWCVGRSEELTNVTVFNSGIVEIHTQHHDGCNSYMFKPLCNMTVKELKALLTEICLKSDFLSDAEFKALKTKAELLDALDEWIED